MNDSRAVNSAFGEDDLGEVFVRPRQLEDFVGQPALRRNLRVFVDAARGRAEAMDHVLFHGPPGLGKTTLAQIVSRELGVGFRATSGPVIAKSGDLAAILTNLEPRDVLFIDEIHRLNPAVEEILYPAMEDGKLDLIIGEGPSARSVQIELPPFTLVGATTRSGLLTTPLRERFGIPLRLEFYDIKDLVKIVRRCAGVLGVTVTPHGATEVAARSRGTPRVAVRLLRRVRDFAVVAGADAVVLPRVPGLPDDAFTSDGNMTKREVRAATLAALAPIPGQHLWDIGAGCGAVSIEWMRAHPACRATAIESRADRIRLIARNAIALGVPRLGMIEGQATDVLAGLDAPDVVFVGGGASTPGLFDLCWDALPVGGRLVANVVTLEGEIALADFRKRHGGELVRIAVSRAEPVGPFTGWKPLMAVTQLAAVKPAVKS